MAVLQLVQTTLAVGRRLKREKVTFGLSTNQLKVLDITEKISGESSGPGELSGNPNSLSRTTSWIISGSTSEHNTQSRTPINYERILEMLYQGHLISLNGP